jgi:hypothetical protein
MAGLVPAIHAFLKPKDVDARHKAGHDDSGLRRGEPRRGEEARSAGEKADDEG